MNGVGRHMSTPGHSVSGAGDVNGDGIDDLIVGAPGADASGEQNAGRAIWCLDRRPASMELYPADLDGTDGFAHHGIEGGLGELVSGAGDVNGDGIDDLIISSNYTPPALTILPGRATSSMGRNPTIGRASILAISMAPTVSLARWRFRVGRGDVNGDGFDDVIVGHSPSTGSRARTIAAILFPARATSTAMGIDDVIVGAPGAGSRKEAPAIAMSYSAPGLASPRR